VVSSSSSSSQIGGVFSHAFERFLRDPIELAIPLEHRKWVPICLQWAARTIAVSIAYIVQKIISAAHSAMRGSQACDTAPHAAPHHTIALHHTARGTTPHCTWHRSVFVSVLPMELLLCVLAAADGGAWPRSVRPSPRHRCGAR
jgi:hypothetical protein